MGLEADGKGSKRPYRMQARAEATAATRERILDAAEQVFDENPTDAFTLAMVAERAGVTVQTVLRHFESRDQVLVAGLVHAGVKMVRNRADSTEDEPRAAVFHLVDHYEKFGDKILRLLTEEGRHSTLRAMTEYGRVLHRSWCERVFESALTGLRGVERERRVAQLVAITDIYTWKLLRRDRQLSRRQTKLAMYELLEPLMGQAK